MFEALSQARGVEQCWSNAPENAKTPGVCDLKDPVDLLLEEGADKSAEGLQKQDKGSPYDEWGGYGEMWNFLNPCIHRVSR